MNQNESDQTDTLNHLANDEAGVHANKFIDLAPYINTSATAVQQTYSLDRTYILFRSLGLRHLVVVDQHNRPTGIITRKDLMGFKIEEKLEAVIEKVKSGESASSGAAATPKHDDGVEMQDTSGSGQQHLNPAYDADA
jgi:signal-transduction protein with cAMP-binding, CBS, and nucleotidyltransferase domain